MSKSNDDTHAAHFFSFVRSVRHLILGACFSIWLFGSASAQELTSQGPLETLSHARGRLVLNGLWKILPAVAPSANAPVGDWGSIWVPGSWIGGFARKGTGPEWKTLPIDLHNAWYQREIDVPSSWKGRRIVLDFRRVS